MLKDHPPDPPYSMLYLELSKCSTEKGLVFPPAALFCHSNCYWLQLVQIVLLVREIIKSAINTFWGSCLKRELSYQVSLVVF